MDEQFIRTQMLLGSQAMERLAHSHVAVFGLGGIGGLLLAMLVAVPLSSLFGRMTGILYNQTRGQETIAGLIVGYFANGLYYFLFLFVMGVVIKMPAGHPMFGQTGIGVATPWTWAWPTRAA